MIEMGMVLSADAAEEHRFNPNSEIEKQVAIRNFFLHFGQSHMGNGRNG